MRRTTLSVSDALDSRLRHEARRRGVPISEVSREALQEYLGTPFGYRVLAAAGTDHSGRSDISERVEEILATDVGE